MSLTREREPVEVLLNPRAVLHGEIPHWYRVTRYIEHQNGDLTWKALWGGPRRRSLSPDWRKVTTEKGE